MLVSALAAIASARSVVARSRPRRDRLLDETAHARLVHRRDRAADGRDLVGVGIDGDDVMALGGKAPRRDRPDIVETENAELHIPLLLHLPRTAASNRRTGPSGTPRPGC